MCFEKLSHSKATFDRTDSNFSTATQPANNLQQASMESASIQSSSAGFSEPV